MSALRWQRWATTVVVIDALTVVLFPNFVRFGRTNFHLDLFLLFVPSMGVGPVLMTRYRRELPSERWVAYAAMATSLLALELQLEANGLLLVFA